MEEIWRPFLFLFGALWGSFTNVLILRIPENISVAFPPSRCPTCKTPIRWYDNVPILAFLWLQGRARCCKEKLSYQYLAVELVSALAFLLLSYLVWPEKLAVQSFLDPRLLRYLFYVIIFVCFLAHFVIDLRHHILPDSLNLVLLATMLAYGLWSYSSSGGFSRGFPWPMLWGGCIGFFGPLSVTYLFYLLRGQVGLGGGDIKLYGILGLYLGPVAIIQTIFLSCFLGAIIGVGLILMKGMKKETPIPFGPFILTVSFTQILFPEFIANLF